MNEIEQKEIEAMAYDIYWEEKDCDILAMSGCEDLAEILIGLGYRNVKDKVVLTKEEYEELRQERSDYITELQETHNENCRLRIELEDIRKETARDIIAKMRKIIAQTGEGVGTYDLDQLAKQYGVEI